MTFFESFLDELEKIGFTLAAPTMLPGGAPMMPRANPVTPMAGGMGMGRMNPMGTMPTRPMTMPGAGTAPIAMR